MYVYMLGAKYGFAQSMNCAAQTMDPHFARAIHGLHVHIFYLENVYFNLFLNPCTCMACINHAPAS